MVSTVGHTLNALGLGRIKNLHPAVSLRRYQWDQPGDMIHVDTNQLTCFERVEYWITGDRRLGSSPGAGYARLRLARFLVVICL